MVQTFVKKIWSLHPNKYKYLRLDTAMSLYETYIVDCIESKICDIKDKEHYPKTFENWLRTEI